MELLVKLGLAVCQFNPNAWRLIISMQILWKEVFGGDRPLTIDKFLFCYKPLEINQSLGFYQFTTRGTNYGLIKFLASSDRNWKTKFFFVFGFQAGNPMDVCRDIFALYTRELGNFRPESMPLPFSSLSFFFFFFYLFYLCTSNPPPPPFIYFYFLYSYWTTFFEQVLL